MRRAILLPIVFLLSSGVAQAQAKRKVTFGFGGGLSLPVKPEEFSDYWSAGPNLSGSVQYPLSTSLNMLFSIEDSFPGVNRGRFPVMAGSVGGTTILTGMVNEDLLGCQVDVITDDGISPYLEDRIYAEAAPL